MKLLLHSKHRQALVIASAMMLALGGCVKDKLDTGSEGEVPLRLTLSIETVGEPDTKAPLMGPNFPAGTHNVGLYILSRPDKPEHKNMVMSVISNGNGNNRMNYYSGVDGTTEIKEITVGSKTEIWILAYFPRIEGLANYRKVPFDLTTTAQMANQTDLLCFPRQTVTMDNAANMPLVFRHVYAMLEFQVTKKYNSAGVVGIKQIRVNNKAGKTWVQNKGTLDAQTNTVTGSSAGSVVVDYADAVNKVEFGSYTTFRVMIPPFSGAYEDDDIEVELTGLDGVTRQKVLIKKKHLTAFDGVTAPVEGVTYAMKSGARYIFRLTYQTPPLPPLKSVVYDGEGTIKTGIPVATRNSYNSYRGTVAGGNSVNGGNGEYFPGGSDSYGSEPPYYQFEVAMNDEAGSTPLVWEDARIACWNKTTDGGHWRLPRISELRMIQLNREALEKTGVEIGRPPEDHWASSEGSDEHSFYMNLNSGNPLQLPKSADRLRVRCVREF